MSDALLFYLSFTTLMGFVPFTIMEDELRLTSMPPRAASLARGMLWLFGSVVWPIMILWLIRIGVRSVTAKVREFPLACVELFRHFFPKKTKIEIPKAKVVSKKTGGYVS